MLLPSPVFGQVGGGTLLRNDVAGNRAAPEFTPRPVQLGYVLAFPSLEAEIASNSNVFNTQEIVRSDVSVRLSPRLNARIDALPAEIDLALGARLTRFADLSEGNTDEYDARLAGSYELSPTLTVDASASYAREAEARGSRGLSLPDAEPPVFREWRNSIGARAEIGQFTLGLQASAIRRTFEDIEFRNGLTLGDLLRDASGGIATDAQLVAAARLDPSLADLVDPSLSDAQIVALLDATGVPALDQSFRDQSIVALSPRIAFAGRGPLSFFATGSVQRATSISPGNRPPRDSDGFSVLAGAEGEITPLLIGSAAIGYRSRQFDDPAYLDFEGLTYETRLEWYPTPLLSLRLDADSNVANSGIPTVAEVRRSTLSLRTFYDPLPDLRASLLLRHDVERYREIATQANRLTVEVRVEKLWSPRLSGAVEIGYRRRDINDSGLLPEYEGWRTALSVTGRL